MNQKRFVHSIIVVLGVIILTGVTGYCIVNRRTPSPAPVPSPTPSPSLTPTPSPSPNPRPAEEIHTFEECAKAGYPVGESYPPQCWTPDGRHFFEKITDGQIFLREGGREGPLLVENIYPEHITGLHFPEYPIAVESGLPITLRIGESASDGCTVTLTLVGIEKGHVATLMKKTDPNRPCPRCLAENTRMDTPSGAIAVQNLRNGAEIWTLSGSGVRVPATILETVRTPVPAAHRVAHLVLGDGRELFVSPGHPTGDGRTVGGLSVGDVLDGGHVIVIEHLPDQHGFTYDMLPSGETGLYWANGILIGSTLSYAGGGVRRAIDNSELKMAEGETVEIPGTEITIRARKVTDQAELEVMQGRATKALALYRSEALDTAQGDAFGHTIELVARREKQITLRVTSSREVPMTAPPGSDVTPPTVSLAAPVDSTVSSTIAVTIDFAVDEGPVTYRASGFFQVAGVPLAMVQPLKPKLVTWIPWLREDYTRAKTLGAEFQLKLGSSGLMGDGAWPGDDGNWTAWLGSIREKVQDVLAQKYVVQYDIWNEPDTEWPRHCGLTESSSALEISRCYGRYLEMWRRTVLLIRELDPHASIVGPSSVRFAFVKDRFLPYALKNNVLPDVLSWHSFGNDLGASLPAEVAEIRQYIKDNGITRIKKISINEYENQSNATDAAVAVKYFYELEKAKPDSAARACWQEGGVWVCSPQLNNLLTPQTCTGPEGPERSCLADWKPRSIWYAYKGYADITGRLVRFTPEENIYGVAGYAQNTGEARVVLGRVEGEKKSVEIEFRNLDRVPFLTEKGKAVWAEAEHIIASGLEAATPVKVISRSFAVSDNTLRLTLPDFGAGDAYTVALRHPRER